MKLHQIPLNEVNTSSDIWLPDKNGNIDVSNEILLDLEGSPKTVKGYFFCFKSHLHSLQGGPMHVDGEYRCHNNNLTTLDCAPQYVGGLFTCISNNIETLRNIHKTITTLKGSFYFHSQKHKRIPTNILGLCLIKDILTIKSDSVQIDILFHKYRHDINLFQDALIDAGFVEQARL